MSSAVERNSPALSKLRKTHFHGRVTAGVGTSQEKRGWSAQRAGRAAAPSSIEGNGPSGRQSVVSRKGAPTFGRSPVSPPERQRASSGEETQDRGIGASEFRIIQGRTGSAFEYSDSTPCDK